MPPRVDPARREIVVGQRRVPFRLDLRNDRVSVTLGGEELAVRPLQWREKLTLARFAHLGPDFLRDEVIRLCTLSELPSPLAPEDADVLWELAAWMSEPPASNPVPLDSRSLAAVTMRLCRAMSLKPADFDSRSAPEVEAMWDVLKDTAGEETAAAPETSSSSTRIVIVPDWEREGPGVGPRVLGSTGARVPGHVPGHATPPQSRGTEDPRTPEPAPIPVKAVTTPAPETPETADEKTMMMPQVMMSRVTTPQELTARMPAAPAPMHLAAATHTETDPATWRRLSEKAMPRWRRISSPEAVPVEPRPAGPAPEERGRDARPPGAPPGAGGTPALLSIGAVALAAAPVEESDSVSAAPHDFFEELADRLEEAAAEMGIGEE